MQNERLKGKAVLITGASTGIGKAAAEAFSLAGAKVAMAARNREKLLENSAAFVNSIALPTDMADERQVIAMVDKTVEAFGRIDLLINNAAMIAMSRTHILNPEILRKAFETNVVGHVIATNRAVKYMREGGGGHIINIGSPGFFIGLPFLSPYAATKAAMCGWTRCLQAEWADTDITVSEYFPGYIKTETVTQSEFGALGQDVFDDPDQNFILKYLAKPSTPDKVAQDLLRCALNPKRIMYSGLKVRLGVWLAQSALFRKAVGGKMARTFCKRLKIRPFG